MTMLLVTLFAATALAGCAAPEETGEPLGDDAGLDDNQTADQTDENQTADDRVAIDGFIYECDTFAEVGVDETSPCEEYQLTEEEADENFTGQQVESQNGEVVINDRTYVCDGDAEPCEEYLLQSEA